MRMRQGRRIGKMVHGVGAPEWEIREFTGAKIERDGNLFVVRSNDEDFEPEWFKTYDEAKMFLNTRKGE